MSDKKLDLDPELLESAEAAREALAEQADALFDALFSQPVATGDPLARVSSPLLDASTKAGPEPGMVEAPPAAPELDLPLVLTLPVPEPSPIESFEPSDVAAHQVAVHAIETETSSAEPIHPDELEPLAVDEDIAAILDLDQAVDFESYADVEELGLGGGLVNEPTADVEEPHPVSEEPVPRAGAFDAAPREPLVTPDLPLPPRDKTPSFPGAPIPRTWQERASFWESEAEAHPDPQRKGRALLLASELWAISGDRERARSAANQAAALLRSSPLALRQQRQLAALDQDWKSVAKTLDIEAEATENLESRAHAVYLGAEIHRLKLNDATGAAQRLERLGQVVPTDPRPPLMRLAQQLAADPGVPKLRFSEALTGDGLPRALDRIRLLRSEGPSSGAHKGDPVLAFEDARRALGIGDRLHASQALLELAEIEGFEQAAEWLAAALLAPSAATRGEAIDILLKLHESTASRTAARALAARALEEGDPTAMTAALDGDNTAAFTQLERVMLAALSGSMLEELPDLVDTLDSGGVAGALAYATRSALGFSHEASLTPAGPQARHTRLGQALAAGDRAEGLGVELAELVGADPTNAAIPLLQIERAYHAGDRAALALGLASWPEKDGDPDAYLAAAVLHELGADDKAASAAYRAALSYGTDLEAVHRAVWTLTEPTSIPSAELEALSDETTDAEAAALLLIEAAYRVGLDDPERVEHLLDRAVERDPTLPFAYRFADTLARSHGDVPQLLDWLERQRAVANTPLELALGLVREALLMADEDQPRAARCLKEAIRAFPRDMALRELFERVSREEALADPWREAAADRAKDRRAQARLLLEAALRLADESPTEACRIAARARDLAPAASLAGVIYDRLAEGSGQAAFVNALAQEAKHGSTAAARIDALERTAQIALRQGDDVAAQRAWRAILEEDPDHRAALRALEHACISTTQEEDLTEYAEHLASLLDAPEALAHGFLYARVRTRQGRLGDTASLLRHLSEIPSAPLWLLRALAAQARLTGDPRQELDAYLRLLDTAPIAEDVATLCLRAAELALAAGDDEAAGSLLDRGLEAVPDHLVLLSTKAEFHRDRAETTAAGLALQAFAKASNVSAHQARALFEAGVLWLESGDIARGEASLEEAALLAPDHVELMERLQRHYAQTNQRTKLSRLRAAHGGATGPLTEVASPTVALGGVDRASLGAALKVNPEHAPTLQAYAELSLAENDPKAAEVALLQLARVSQESDKQEQHYRRLAELYDGPLLNPQRAVLCYREVLKRAPDDAAALEKVVGIYHQLQQGEPAAQLLTQLLQATEDAEARANLTVRLAEVYELTCHDRERALLTLQEAYERAPQSSVIVHALAQLYLRAGDTVALDLLLESAAESARETLASGDLGQHAFQLLVTIAELMGNLDAAKVIGATWSVLQAEDAVIEGAGPIAGDRAVEEFLAYELLPAALRNLFYRAGGALDGAFVAELNLASMGLLAERNAELANWYGDLAQAFGVTGLELLVSTTDQLEVIAASSSPPIIVFGETLLQHHDQEAITFLFYRALKLVQAKLCALGRGNQADRKLRLDAFLASVVDNWQPPEPASPALIAEIRNELVPVDDELRSLGRETIRSSNAHPIDLGNAIDRWANRTALFAIGDIAAAFRGVALLSGAGDVPQAAAERLHWVTATAAACDLAVFSASREYDAARLHVGLGLDDQVGIGLEDIEEIDSL